jgi:serine/threonine protein kinase
MRKYRLVAKKGEGTFSEVLKAQNIKDGKYRAIKCMKNRFESIDQVNNLREIQALRRLSPHEHIVSLEEVLYDQPTGRLALVFELMDANLYELIKGLFQSCFVFKLFYFPLNRTSPLFEPSVDQDVHVAAHESSRPHAPQRNLSSRHQTRKYFN